MVRLRLLCTVTVVATVLVCSAVHRALTTAVLVAATVRHHRLVLLSVHLGQLIEEGDDPPDVLIPHALAPRRHACGLDAMLDGPERHGGIITGPDVGQVRRRG